MCVSVELLRNRLFNRISPQVRNKSKRAVGAIYHSLDSVKFRFRFDAHGRVASNERFEDSLGLFLREIGSKSKVKAFVLVFIPDVRHGQAIEAYLVLSRDSRKVVIHSNELFINVRVFHYRFTGWVLIVHVCVVNEVKIERVFRCHSYAAIAKPSAAFCAGIN